MGPNAALSHRDAAALHGLRLSNGALIDVSTSAARKGGVGVRAHARVTLDLADITTVDAIPVTTVARTLVDLAGIVPPDNLAKTLSEAERLGKLDVRALDAALKRTRGRHGQGHQALSAALAELVHHGPRLTRSELEDRFVALLDAHSLPSPHMNARIEGVEVDALWPAEGVVVELDGYAFHRGARSFQRDREKTNDLLLAGYVVLRFTYEDVVRRPAATAERVARALSRARGFARPPRAAARRGS
jgi:very-short-patch-repair endonuclease